MWVFHFSFHLWRWIEGLAGYLMPSSGMCRPFWQFYARHVEMFISLEQIAFILSVFVVPDTTILMGGDREITVEANSTQQDESWKVCLELTPAQPYVRLVARIPIEFMATFSSHNCAVPQLFTPSHCSLPHIAFFYSVPSTSHPQRGPQAHVMYSPSLISPVPTAPPPPPP